MSGNLWFKSGLDNTQLKRDTEQAKTHIKGLSEQVQSESKKMDSSFSGIGAGMAAIGGTAAIGMLGKQILDTTAKFEKFGIVLKNTLGDLQGQAALDMLSQFAATTPFQLDEVTGSFIKMANQGFVPTREEMVKLGDVASSTGKSFDQLTEALLDAQTGQFERLKEFGIKASAQGDKVTFSFKEQQTTIDNTNSAIQKYILSLGDLKGVQGANDLISASLTGQISNLEDKLAMMYNNIGKSNSGFLYAAVGGVTSLIDNYETVGKVVFDLVVVYGAYKATVLIVNAVTALQTQIAYQQTLANIGNTGSTIQLTTAQGLQAVMASNLTRIQLALNKSMLANPYVLAAMAITTLVIAMSAYANSAKEAKTQKEMLNDLEGESQKNTSQEVSKLESLKKILNDSNKSYGERKVALDKLKEIVPDYHANLTNEGVLINNNSDALDTYVKKLVIAEKIKIAAVKQSNADEAFNNYKTENADVLKTAVKKKFSGEELFAGEAGALSKLTELAKEAQNYGTVIDQLQADLVAIDAKAVKRPVSKTPAQIKAEEAARLKEYQENQSDLKAYQDKLLSDKEKADKAEYERMKSTITDKKDLIDLELEQTLEGIDREEAALRSRFEKKDKKGNLITIKDENGKPIVFDNSPFDAQRKTAYSQAHSDKQTVDKEDAKALKEQLDAMLLEYQSFEEKRKALNAKYDKERKILVENKKKPGANVQQIDSAIQIADQYNDEDNQAIDKAIAEKEVSFKGFVDRITKMGLDELLKALEGANNAMRASGATDEEKAVLRAKIVALQEQIKSVKTNGGKDSESDVITNAGLAKAKNTVDILKNVGSEIDNVINGFEGMDAETKTALQAASNITMAVITSIAGIISLSVVGSEAIKGVERASVILAIIGAAISVITIIIGLFTSAAAKRKQEEEAEIERQKQSYLGLIDYNAELRKKYEWTKKIGEAELLYIARTGAELKKQSSANSKDQSDLFAKLQNQTYNTGEEKWTGGFLGIGMKKESVTASLAGKTYEEISQLAAQGKLSKEGNDYYEALKKAKQEGDDLAKRQEEYLEQVRETFTGTTSQTITDSIIEGFKAGKRSAADFADTFESLMQGAVLKALSNMTDEKVRKWYEEFAEMSKDGLTPEEKAKLKADWDKLVSENAADAANLESATGVSITDIGATRTATSKGIQSISQDSADELNGRFTAIQGHTFSINESVKVLAANSPKVLETLMGIKGDTARLENIELGIGSMKQSLSDITLKGINIKVG